MFTSKVLQYYILQQWHQRSLHLLPFGLNEYIGKVGSAVGNLNHSSANLLAFILHMFMTNIVVHLTQIEICEAPRVFF